MRWCAGDVVATVESCLPEIYHGVPAAVVNWLADILVGGKRIALKKFIPNRQVAILYVSTKSRVNNN